MTDETRFHKVAELDELPEGRVKTVTVGRRSLALANVDGRFGALDNHCPHQGGPLGEGSIEPGRPVEEGGNGGAWLRCPWHGYDYDPLDGQPPEGFSDAPACFATEVREDGVYVELPADPPRERTVSDVMVETMIAWGVTHVFGMVGHSNLGFADAMREAEERGELTFIGIRHEGAASFAATAYGKLTGRLAACFGIAGPGSTNLLTGLYDAKVDRAPVLALSGQVPSKVMGRGAFQDLALDAAFADVARFNRTVLAGSDHGELMSLACKTAIVERDVAHLTLPDEVQVLPAENRSASGPEGRTGDRAIAPPAEALDEAVTAIRAAERPMVLLGQGARHDRDQVIALAEQIGAPMVTTFKAKGAVSDHHPLGCGVLGRSGTPIASWFMNECDLIVVFGASFSNHTGIADYKKIVQVDADPMALGRFHPVDLPVLGDVGRTAALMAQALSAESPRSFEAEVAERWGIWRAEKEQRRADRSPDGVGAASVFEALSGLVDDDAVICVDVGNNTYSFGRYFEVEGQDVLMSGYLGSIGFGLPAAMGAWAAVGGERQVVGISGDGGLGQYAMELTTAAKYDMDIAHVVLDNGELGKISKEQRSAELDVWQTSLVNPDFAAFAELCGVRGFRIEDPDAIEATLAEALAHRGPALVSRPVGPLAGLTAALLLIHGGVGILKEPIHAGRVLVQGDADAGPDGPGLRFDRERFCDLTRQTVGQRLRFVPVRHPSHDDELVAAVPADDVTGTNTVAQPARHRGEHDVAGLMAEPVVDRLEVVQVDEQQRQGLVGQSRALEDRPDALHEAAPIEHGGQGVVIRLSHEGIPLGPRPGCVALLDRHVGCERHQSWGSGGIAGDARDPERQPRRSLGIIVAWPAELGADHLGQAGSQQGELAFEAQPLLLVQGVTEHSAGEGVGGLEDQPGERVVGTEDHPVRIDLEHAELRLLDRLPQEVLGVAQTRDVPGAEDDPVDGGILDPVGHMQLEPAPFALTVDQPGIDEAAAPAVQLRRGSDPGERVVVVGMDQGAPGSSDDLTAEVAQQPGRGRAGPLDLTVAIQEQREIGRGVEHRP